MIGVIGFGNMGKAIALRFGKKILVSDIDIKKINSAKHKSVEMIKSNIELVKRSNVVILAVKPQNFPQVLKEIAPYVKNKLIISIAAGIKTSFIERALNRARVVRVMPNMPALAGEGMSSISRGKFASEKDMKIARNIFLSVGEVVEVKEDKVDAVTALSGSGPAYYFLFTNLLERAGISIGLEKNLARKLALATFIGSGEIARLGNISMEGLVDKVASKGGTTEAALKVFKSKKLDKIVTEAVRSACSRSKHLSKLIS